MQYTANRLVRHIIIETSDNETILKAGGANHVKGKEGVGAHYDKHKLIVDEPTDWVEMIMSQKRLM